jgi:2-polyprenyl-3-methyl-5-hydroxy-6-metoxy-1,4-benzoquinol methylase
MVHPVGPRRRGKRAIDFLLTRELYGTVHRRKASGLGSSKASHGRNFWMVKINYEGSPWGAGDSGGQNRLQNRAQKMFGDNSQLLKGKRVLDLACNNGRMAYGAISAGAAHVTGVEIRDELIEDGRKKMSETGNSERMTFQKGDIFEFLDAATPGQFDVILCLGFLYHTVRQADFFRGCARLRPEAVFVDTSVAKNYWWFGRSMFGKPPALFVAGYENPEETRNTFDDDGLVYWPTCSYLEELFTRSGYKSDRVDYSTRTVSNWAGMKDYKKGTRASFVATRIG